MLREALEQHEENLSVKDQRISKLEARQRQLKGHPSYSLLRIKELVNDAIQERDDMQRQLQVRKGQVRDRTMFESLEVRQLEDETRAGV